MASRCSGALRVLLRPSPIARHQPTAQWRRCLATTASTSAAAAEAPPPSPAGKPALNASHSEALGRIVDEISGLTLMQASDLVGLLKSRLNIQEVAVQAAAPAAAAVVEEAVVVEAPKEKTVFNVMLESFEAGSKPKVIREVKALVPNLTLIDAKKFVEALPKVLKENLTKDEAEKLKKVFEGLGAVVKLD